MATTWGTQTGVTVSNANKTITGSASGQRTIRSVDSMNLSTTGQIIYFELTITQRNTDQVAGIGIADSGQSGTGWVGDSNNSYGLGCQDGHLYHNSGGTDTTTTWATGDRVGVAINTTTSKMGVRKNGGSWLNSFVPTTGAGGYPCGTGAAMYIGGTVGSTSDILILRTAAADLVDTPPAGWIEFGPAGGRTATATQSLSMGQSATGTVALKATATQSLSMGQSATSALAIKATATQSLSMGQSATSALAIKAAAAQSLGMGQSATSTLLIQAAATQSLSMGQTATGTFAAGISGTATQSLSMGQTATGEVLIKATAAQSFSMGQTATGALEIQAQATQQLSMGQSATGKLEIHAVADQSLSMGQVATAILVDGIHATADQSLSMGQTATGKLLIKATAAQSLHMGQIATAKGARDRTKANHFNLRNHGKRVTPAIQEPTEDPKALRTTVGQLKEAVETMQGQRGKDHLNTTITYQDLVNLGLIDTADIPVKK